jgi:Ca2+-binding RTX toxin-like protein
MSRPAFDRRRGEIWYSDGFQGFFVVHVTNGVWPFPKCKGTTSTLGVYSATTKGTRGADVIVGRGAAEAISSAGGRDKLCGRAGNDRLRGGGGGDILRGGDGNDKVVGGSGRDRVDCGRGRGDLAILGAGDRARRCERIRRR